RSLPADLRRSQFDPDPRIRPARPAPRQTLYDRQDQPRCVRRGAQPVEPEERRGARLLSRLPHPRHDPRLPGAAGLRTAMGLLRSICAGAALLAAGCVPDLSADLWRVDTPRILAIAAEPA